MYEYVMRLWDQGEFPILYDTELDVPPLPTWEELGDMLESHPFPEPSDTADLLYRLEFDGTTTTASGAAGQNLDETVYSIFDTGPVFTGGSPETAFLSRLLVARPDLKETIMPHIARSAAAHGEPAGGRFQTGVDALKASPTAPGPSLPLQIRPYLIHGGAWRKTAEWIGTYGDIDTLLAWKFLESELDPGHEFSHQLVPSLTDDVYLHCHVVDMSSYQSEIGELEKAVLCHYVIDYGIGFVDDIYQGTGYYRVFDYGRVIYAPSVGPVYCYERLMVQTGSPHTVGNGDRTLTLISTNAGMF
jgi:hypothetical protein